MSNFIRGRHAPSLPAFLLPDSTEGPPQASTGLWDAVPGKGPLLPFSSLPYSLPPEGLGLGQAGAQFLPAVSAGWEIVRLQGWAWEGSLGGKSGGRVNAPQARPSCPARGAEQWVGLAVVPTCWLPGDSRRPGSLPLNTRT